MWTLLQTQATCSEIAAVVHRTFSPYLIKCIKTVDGTKKKKKNPFKKKIMLSPYYCTVEKNFPFEEDGGIALMNVVGGAGGDRGDFIF